MGIVKTERERWSTWRQDRKGDRDLRLVVSLVPRGFLEFRVGSEAVGKLDSSKTVCVGKRMDKQRGLLVLDKTNRGTN